MEEAAQQVRAAAFWQILETGRPAPITDLAAAAGTGEAQVRAAAGQLLAAGRARLDENGDVTAAAGLSVQPTRHGIQTRHGSRWTTAPTTRLASSALGADGEITSTSPLTGRQIRVPPSATGTWTAATRCCSSPTSPGAGGPATTGAPA
jgi:hypothetical protein